MDKLNITPADTYLCETCGKEHSEFVMCFGRPEPLGWRCPVCGRGLAPDVRECSCVDVDEDGFDWEYRPPYVPPPEADDADAV